MIRIEALRLHLDGRVLLDIPRLDIAPGGRVALVGPNGAGKSSLLRLLAGQAPGAWQGRVELLGRSLPVQGEALRALRAELAWVPQGAALVGRLSARDNLLNGALARCAPSAAWRGRFPAAIEAEAEDWLHRLDLQALADTRADRLSGGERQRVAIGRAALQHPRLLLADEATAALDPRAAAQACAWLRRAADPDGSACGALLVVLHQLELLPALAERVIGLRDGRLVLDRPVDASADLAAALAELYAMTPARRAPAAAHALPVAPRPCAGDTALDVLGPLP